MNGSDDTKLAAADAAAKVWDDVMCLVEITEEYWKAVAHNKRQAGENHTYARACAIAMKRLRATLRTQRDWEGEE